MVRVYNFFIRLYSLAIRLAAPFNRKAKLWVQGRRNQFERLSTTIDPTAPLIWMHCASLGEFEQGLPVLERIKTHHPEFRIMVTFFSPSGFEIRKNHPVPDYVFYLPADTPGNAERFIKIARPGMAIFVRYEFWYNYLAVLSANDIPLILLSAIFRTEQVFFKPWGGFFRKMPGFFDRIFVQDEISSRLLGKLGFNHVEVSGDTRVDRVCQIAEQPFEDPLISAFAGLSNVFAGGSTWPPDDNIIAPLINEMTNKNWKFIIAPHDIKTGQIEKFERQLKVRSLRYSEQDHDKAVDAKVLIIDNIGLLSKLYRYCKIAYVGGGFGISVHNILEPLVYGIPVIFGPRYRHIREACLMAESRTGIPVNGEKELKTAFLELTDSERYAEVTYSIKTFIDENKGATDQVFGYLSERLSR